MKLETPLQAQVLVILLEKLPVEPEAQIFHFSYTHNPARRYYAAAARLRDCEEAIWVIATLCSHASDRVFVTLTDGDPQVVAGILSGIERFHVEDEAVDEGHTLDMSSRPALQQRGLTAALLLIPAITPPLQDLPYQTMIGEHHAHFLLTIFLSDAEYQLKKQHGLEALLQQFETENKDLIRFGNPS
jgi:hypothetical protein